MHLNVRVVSILILLLGTALAQSDLLSALAQLPACTKKCSAQILPSMNCSVSDLSTCLCRNVTVQRDLALCLIAPGSCNLTEQATTLRITQNEICAGIPQPSRSTEIIRDITVIAAVTFPIILLRFISRKLVSNSLWWDDWAIALAAVVMVPMTIIPILNATRGFGNHFWDVPPQNTVMLRKLYYISQIFYVVVQSLAKFSILLLYLRIFLDKQFRLILNIVMGWMACKSIACLLVVVFQCTPVSYVWDLSLSGKCINSQAFIYSAAATGIAEDFVVMFLPVLQLRTLKLDLKKKTVLSFMFALGSFACVTSMIRLKYIISYGTSIDLTYDNVDVIIWSVLETFFAIICASLMCMRPLLVRLFPALFPTSKDGTSKGTPNNITWATKMASKLRSGNNGVELLSDDEERGAEEKVIRVQKTWATTTETSFEMQENVPEGTAI